MCINNHEKNLECLTSFEIQEEPAIAEIEVGVVSILVHVLKQLRVQNLKPASR